MGSMLPSRGRLCADCDTPIAKGSRARCRPCAYIARKMLMPANFMTAARGLTIAEIMALYDVGKNVAKNWRDASGLGPQPRRQDQVKSRAVRSMNAKRPTITGIGASPPRARNDGSRAAGAAEFLQRLSPVYRCDKLGRPDPKGAAWRRGSAVLSDEEIVERAEHRGWRPDAWRQLHPTTDTTKREHA